MQDSKSKPYKFIETVKKNYGYLEMQEGSDLCPSFNSYSNNGIADTALRVYREQHSGELLDLRSSILDEKRSDSVVEEYEFDDDFEFISLRQAGEQPVFFDGSSFGPVFPVFDHDLLEHDHDDQNDENLATIRIPLEKLVIGGPDRDRYQDRDLVPLSSSSSEVDELEGVPSASYCVWTPTKSVERTGGQSCKKSKSTGSSTKRWIKLLDLLRRSNSDGKESLVFLTPSSRSNSMKKKEDQTAEKARDQDTKEIAPKSKAAKKISGEKVTSAHEVFYVRKRMSKEVGKRRSYLPYKQDLVGFWTNVNSYG